MHGGLAISRNRVGGTRPGLSHICRSSVGGLRMTVQLHYTVDGPPGAPALLLASALGTTGAMWQPQVSALAQRFRLVRIDHRGHGKSPTPPGPYAIEDMGR